MAKPIKSQWEFGELFPAQAVRRVFTVSELTGSVRRLLEKEFGATWVTGEITNLRVQSSGHIYFTLKDPNAQLSCVLFRGEGSVDRALLEDGRKVVLGGNLTVYEPRGQYQLRVTAVELQGVGALQIAFEKLKQKLKSEGLFAAERKRPLPTFPRRIGLVTSPTGAAIRDVLHVVQRRNPALEIVLAPCRVQGEGAAVEIAEAISLLNDFHASALAKGDPRGGLDLVLITRGGGSLEDLWAFNEETVARAIFKSVLPVVSAVGHEIDFTISDFVADVRAATPSAAAEIITEDVFGSRAFLQDVTGRLLQLVGMQIESKLNFLEQASQRLGRLHPRRIVNDRLQRLDDLQGSLGRCAKQGLRQEQVTWQNWAARLARVRPALVVGQRREVLGLALRGLNDRVQHRLGEWNQQVAAVESRLRLLGPEQVLARGYSITTEAETGKVLRKSTTVKPGQRIHTRLHRGTISSRVEA